MRDACIVVRWPPAGRRRRWRDVAAGLRRGSVTGVEAAEVPGRGAHPPGV